MRKIQAMIASLLLSLTLHGQAPIPNYSPATEVESVMTFVYDSVLNPISDPLFTLVHRFTEEEKTMNLLNFRSDLKAFEPNVALSIERIERVELGKSYLSKKINKELRDYKQSLIRFHAVCADMISKKGDKMDQLSNNKLITAYHHLGLSRSLLMAAMDTRFYFEHQKALTDGSYDLSAKELKETSDSLKIALQRLDLALLNIQTTKAELKAEIRKARIWSIIGGVLCAGLTILALK